MSGSLKTHFLIIGLHLTVNKPNVVNFNMGTELVYLLPFVYYEHKIDLFCDMKIISCHKINQCLSRKHPKLTKIYSKSEQSHVK